MSLRLLCLQIALVFFGVVIAISEQSLVAALLLYLLCHTDGKCQVWVFFCPGLGGLYFSLENPTSFCYNYLVKVCHF